MEVSGVGKDEATRADIKTLSDEIGAITSTFGQNINNSVKFTKVKAERLVGVPKDYFDGNPVDEDGFVSISSSWSDIYPIAKYAHDRAVRAKVLLMYDQRAVEENQPLLLELLEKRYELARLLGFENYAEMDLKGSMVGNPENLVDFLTKLSNAIEAPINKERERLLIVLQELDSQAKKVKTGDAIYLAGIVKEKDYALDAKQVRQYFHYEKVRNGIFSLSEDLFGLSIKPVNIDTWHPSVEAYEIHEGDKLIGRFFLDSHPREGKYTHNAQYGINLGRKGESLPEAALIMNFSKDLIEHGEASVFLHEFGHLLHYIFAGQNEVAYSRNQTELDFGEAPSRMLEEWFWNYETLAKFATNSKGKLIPKELVKKMNDARHFGIAGGTGHQLAYTAMSFEIYNRNPKGINLDLFEKDVFTRYSPYGYDEGARMHASFEHITSYGAKYYTYKWSDAIAEELLSRFKREGMRNKKTANAYRKIILERTGTRSASSLVKEFLGRDYTVEAYVNKLTNAGESD
jgi:thimet oligopeptidase